MVGTSSGRDDAPATPTYLDRSSDPDGKKKKEEQSRTSSSSLEEAALYFDEIPREEGRDEGFVTPRGATERGGGEESRADVSPLPPISHHAALQQGATHTAAPGVRHRAALQIPGTVAGATPQRNSRHGALLRYQPSSRSSALAEAPPPVAARFARPAPQSTTSVLNNRDASTTGASSKAFAAASAIRSPPSASGVTFAPSPKLRRSGEIKKKSSSLPLLVKLALTFLALFFTATAFLYRRASSSYAAKIDHELHRMAAKIVHLKREARKARGLEIEDERLEGELSKKEVELNKREKELKEIAQKEAEERHMLEEKEEEVHLLQARLATEEKEKDEEIKRLVEEMRAVRAQSQLRGDGNDVVTVEMERRLRDMFGQEQGRSRARALEKYGPGPHRVAITIDIPPIGEIWPGEETDSEDEVDGGDDSSDEDDDDEYDTQVDDDCLYPEGEFFNDDNYGPGSGCQPTYLKPSDRTIIFEMASLDLMPHSVEIFLDQVAKGLWDETFFVRNAGHVLQATPKIDLTSPWIADVDRPDDTSLNLTQRFVDEDRMHVHFQEYHHSHPHEKYTVGFAGRPGGPMFYINKRDNTDAHGPGGQSHGFGKWDDAEPCFAKVVKGFEAVRWMAGVPTDERNHEGLDRMRRYVKIKEARVLSKEAGERRMKGLRETDEEGRLWERPRAAKEEKQKADSSSSPAPVARKRVTKS